MLLKKEPSVTVVLNKKFDLMLQPEVMLVGLEAQ